MLRKKDRFEASRFLLSVALQRLKWNEVGVFIRIVLSNEQFNSNVEYNKQENNNKACREVRVLKKTKYAKLYIGD